MLAICSKKLLAHLYENTGRVILLILALVWASTNFNPGSAESGHSANSIDPGQLASEDTN